LLRGRDRALLRNMEVARNPLRRDVGRIEEIAKVALYLPVEGEGRMRREQTKINAAGRTRCDIMVVSSIAVAPWLANSALRQADGKETTGALRARIEPRCARGHTSPLYGLFLRECGGAASIARFTKQEGRAGFVSAPMGLGGVPHDLGEASTTLTLGSRHSPPALGDTGGGVSMTTGANRKRTSLSALPPPVIDKASAHIRAAVSLHRSRASRSSPRPGPSFMAPSPLRLAPT
jgi:hypothetical protein